MKNIARFIFRRLARLILRRYQPTVVAIAGSVGKTGTKEAVAVAVATPVRTVRKTPGNFNAEIGVPATVLSGASAPTGWLDWLRLGWTGVRQAVFGGSYPSTLVLELAADHPGDLRPLLSLIKPSIGVLTSAAPEHLEFFGDEAGVVEEESLVVRLLNQQQTAVINIDDPRIADLTESLKCRVITYGWSSSAMVRGVSLQPTTDVHGLPDGMVAVIVVAGQQLTVSLPGVLGRHQVYPILAAVATAVALGDDVTEAVARLSAYVPPPGRMRLFHGRNGALLIDDSYNASPEAVQAALRSLSEIEVPGQRIAVLGQMSELGAAAADWHDRIGREIARLRIHQLVTVGPLAERIGTSAISAGFSPTAVRNVPNAIAAAASLQTDLQPGTAILLKGSRYASRLEQTVAVLLENPDRDTKFLVASH